MIKFDKETLQERKELIGKQLSTGITEVTFTKVDGSVRVMPCTLDSKLLPTAPVHETNTDNPIDFPRVKKENPAVMSVYCTDKQAWRSFRIDNVISMNSIGE